MALDEAILDAVGKGASLPTLRLYTWQPPCLSLGYAQTVKDVDRESLMNEGWELVRRPTGGRALLHTDELTYAVIGPSSEPRLMGSVLDCYRNLAGALLGVLELLGLSAHIKEHPMNPARKDQPGPVCFEIPSDYEILANDKKIIGSAQSRKGQGVLQHGSLPLCGDITRITKVLVFTNDDSLILASQRMTARATTLAEALGHTACWDTLVQAFINSFQEKLHLDLLPAEPTSDEIARATILVQEKYGNPFWTERV